MKRVKVFEILECGSPHGVGRQIAELCRHLDRKKFELWVVYSARPGCTPREFEELTSHADRRIHIPEMVRPVHPLKDIEALIKLYRLIRRERPEVVHAHSSKAGVLGRLAARLAGVPRIYYTPHGYGFLQTDVRFPVRMLYWLFEWMVSWTGHIVSTSTGEAGLARRLSWGKEVFVVFNLFSMEGETSRGPDNGCSNGHVTVCALGRLSPARNPAAFLRLAGSLASRYPSLRLVWIGGGEMEDRLRLQVAESGLQDRMEITGHVPDRIQVLKRLEQADVFIHYSSWEGSPVAVLEAMFFEKPVVASRISGNDDLVEEGVTGYLASSEEELAERVGRLVESPELRREMGRKGKERLGRVFALEKSVAALEALYLGKKPYFETKRRLKNLV